MLALTIALVAPYFVDWTSYRADFEREASRILGREVKVEGTATARLLPFPSVTFTDVVVGGVEPDETAMTIETFSMDAELAPFMRGDVHIFDMRLVRPSAVIDIAEDGTLDWAVRPSVPVAADHISLEKLTITEGRVAIRHAASGRMHLATEINADVSARALSGPWRLDGSLRLDGMRSAMTVSTGSVDEDGRLRLRLRVQPERYPMALETDGNVRIEEGGVRYAGQFRLNAAAAAGGPPAAGDAAGPAAYRLSGSFDFDHTALKVEEFRFETGSAEDPYTAEGSAEFALGAEPRFEIRADGAQVRFEDATGQAAGGFGLDERLAAFREFLLDMPRPAIPGRIEVKLPAIVAGDTTLRDVHLSAEPSEEGWTVASLGATLPGRATLEAKGELTVADELGFAGSLLLAVGQPSGFAAWLSKDIDDAIRRLPAAGFSARVDLAEERQSFRDLELILGAAKFRGEIDSRTPANERPSMTLRLDGDRLDVEGMAAFASLFVGDGGQTRLADRDLEFEITAGPVSAAGLTAETLDTALRLKDGRLEIDRLAIGGLAGANVSATGVVTDPGGAVTGTIDASIIAADLEPLAAALAERFPESRLAGAIARRAALYPGLLDDASIHLVASTAGDRPTLSARGEAGGTEFTLSAAATDTRAALTAAPVTLELSARNDEAAALYALLGLPALPIGFAGAAQTELAFDGVVEEGGKTRFAFSGDGISLTFEGETALKDGTPSANGSAALETDDIEPWLVTGGVSLPGFGLGLPARATAQLDLDGGLLVLSGLRGEVAGSTVTGDVNAQLRDGLPHVTGDLSLRAFDLGAVAELAAGAQALAGDGEGWPTAPFAQGVATPLTADLDLAVERLRLGGFAEAADARLTLRIGREGVSVSDARGRVHGGTLSGILDFRNDGGTGLLSAQLRLAGARLVDLVGEIGLAGEIDLTASLTASGKSVDGIVSALAGSGTASVRDPAIAGVAPQAFAALIERADAIGPGIDADATAGFAPPIVRDGIFRADGVDIAFTVANGTVRAPPLRLETAGAALTGEVRADLSARRVEADATLTYDPGAEALVGSEPAVRFVAAGPLDGVGVEVDTEPLAQFLTQRALELEQQRVEAMQALLLERQRHRREVRYYAALADQRERSAEEARRAAEEAERLEREMRLRSEEEARRAAEEAARAAEAEEARRRAAEEEARRLREEEERRRTEEQTRLETEEAERAREAAERQRLEDERLRAEVEALLNARAAAEAQPEPEPDPDAIERLPIDPPAVVNVTPTPAPRETVRRVEAAPQSGAGVFSEENLTIDGLMRAIGESR